MSVSEYAPKSESLSECKSEFESESASVPCGRIRRVAKACVGACGCACLCLCAYVCACVCVRASEFLAVRSNLKWRSCCYLRNAVGHGVSEFRDAEAQLLNPPDLLFRILLVGHFRAGKEAGPVEHEVLRWLAVLKDWGNHN
eukprot:2447202-Alexandrium_andersonii.AAC.1